jgi:hypothetical protein
MDSFADISPSTPTTDSLSNHTSLPACHNVAALKSVIPPGHLTIWGESIVVQWADKECRRQPDSFYLGEAIVKLTLKDPFMR